MILKRIVLCVVFVLFMHSTPAVPHTENKVLWDNIPSAMEHAKQSSKMCILIFGADWCSYCIKLKNQVLKDPNLTNDAVICYIDIDDQPEMAKKYNATTLPKTLYFLNGKDVKTIVGYHNMIPIMEQL